MDARRKNVPISEAERNVLDLCDMERRRIGQDLHDGIGQQLTGIHLMTKTLERRLHDQHSSEADFARSIAGLMDETIQQVRRVVAGMAPPEVENQDAAAALKQLCRRIEDMHQIECLFCNLLTTMITDTSVIKNLYFIVTEAVHNAIRHGKADQVKVILTDADSDCELLILNNGSFDGKKFTGQPGIGLNTMQFRAQALNGWLRIQPEENHSISIICRFSLSGFTGRTE
jgi:two-component system, LuxR family, sensor kinase FixL